MLAATFWVGRGIYRVPAGTLPITIEDATVSEPERAEFLVTEGMEAGLLSLGSFLENEPGRNPFQFGSEPLPEVSQSDAAAQSTAETGIISESPPVVAPPSTLPPPPIPFRYNGYAVVDLSGEITALLSDSGRSFVVSVQDVVMGRYRINAVTEEFVEIEDLEFGSRQRLLLITQ